MSHPFLDDYLLYLLARASSVASGQFHAELARQGIPVLTWRVLAALHDGPATVGTLAEATLTKQTTLSKALDRMERDGLVRRQRHATDRRQVRVESSGKGRLIAQRLIEKARTHQNDLLSGYAPEDRETLIRVLSGFLDRAEQAKLAAE